jgi:aryl-alcohol dehydrogenase-like predicted oxidoreductase
VKNICLGTAMWGWSVEQSTVFAILDSFYEFGGRYIDTANNYPLNGNASDYRKSPLFLSQWCHSRKVSDLKITCKIGSVSNSNTPNNDLTPDYLQKQVKYYMDLFNDNFYCAMLHWDNRSDINEIEGSLLGLDILSQYNIELGLSGISHPSIYADLLLKRMPRSINIQVKHNFLHSGLENFQSLSSFSPKIWAYGISASGLKLSPQEYNSKSYVSLVRGKNYHNEMLNENIKAALKKCIATNHFLENIYHLSIAFAEQEEQLFGYLVAPTKLEQMQDILRFVEQLSVNSIDLKCLSEIN